MGDEKTQTQPRPRSAGVGWRVALGFFTVAAFLGTRAALAPIPLAPMAAVARADIRVGPRRDVMRDPATILVGGHQQTCNDCHRIFAPRRPAGRAISLHGDVVLNHGQNNRCFNCHDPRDLQRLVLHDGTAVVFAETPRLCAQCHGTVYRDWQNGTHGKTLGSWNAGSGEQVRLTCNQCHNPHSPAYERLRPLPAPNTLRMGDQSVHENAGDGEKVSPLEQVYRERRGEEAPPPAPHPGTEVHR